MSKIEFQLDENNADDRRVLAQIKNDIHLYNSGIGNAIVRQISDHKLYVNLGVLAGWAALHNFFSPAYSVLAVLVPVFAVLSIVVILAGLHFAHRHDVNGPWRGMLEVWCTISSNFLTITTLVMFLVLASGKTL